MSLQLNRRQVLTAVLIWGGLFVLLSALHFNAFQLLNIFGFLTLIILPGLLTVLILRVRNVPAWGYLGLVVGFSILELLLTVLIGNAIVPHLGIERPLDRPMLLIEFTGLIAVLAAANWALMKDRSLLIPRLRIFTSVRDVYFTLIPLIFVAMAAMGAMRLNNGGSGTLTLLMLIGIAVYIAFLIHESDRVGPNVIPTAIFLVALALLLMTSLRSFYITGHDIQKEYVVFQLAKSHGIWAIANYRDAYNACMSITILPTLFSNLLHLPDPDVYKVLFQILFAIVPVILFLTATRYLKNALALIAVLYFMAFPTFFTDMSFLNRQEIAFLFLALMFFVILRDDIPVVFRRVVFVLFGIGMTLSHYTTTYTIVASLVVVVCIRPIERWVRGWIKKMNLFPLSGLAAFSGGEMSAPRVTVAMVITLILASFIWSSVLTNTASNSIERVFTETISVMLHNTKEDAGSNDAHYGLFSFQQADPSISLHNYVTQVVNPARLDSPSIYYASSTYGDYAILATSTETLPLTGIGASLTGAGLNVPLFNYIFRQASAKVLQLFIVIGFIGILFSRRYLKNPLETEFVVMAVVGLLLMVSQLVIPVLSQEYGLLRAFQQSLMFLDVFLVVGSATLAFFFRKEGVGVLLASVIAIIFFLSSTGVFTQILGGYDPQLHLNNSGLYYDLYYAHAGEIAASAWLSARINIAAGDELQSESQSVFYRVQGQTPLLDSGPLNDMYPGLIRKNAYVYLDFENVRKQQSTISYNGSEITYAYPLQFLDNTKDLIYDSGDARIYR